MSEPLNVSNTLVNQPVNYIGHNPYRWKWIGKWDSDTFLKDVYTDSVYNLPQYDIVPGQGIVVVDDIGDGPGPCCIKGSADIPKKDGNTNNGNKTALQNTPIPL